MSVDETTGNRIQRPEGSYHSGRGDLILFRELSYELLACSTKGLLRKDFLPMVSEIIRKHSGCDATELWVKEGNKKHFRCSVTGSGKMTFGFILVPCALGEEAAPPPDDSNELGIEEICCRVITGNVRGLSPHVTGRGSFLAGGSVITTNSNTSGPDTCSSISLHLPAPYRSMAIIPVRLDGNCIGLLQLKSRNKDFFSVQNIGIYEDIADILGVALSHQNTHIELRERIKELTCLHGIAREVAQPDVSFAEIILNIVKLLPPAWLYPDIACARIMLNGDTYTTDGFRESPHKQVSDIIVNNEKVGSVELVYSEKRLTLDEGPFLAEERSLIDNVAQEIAIFYERARAEAETASLQEQLRHADRLATIGQLAAGVAHELNEPLGNILGFAQLAKKSPDLPEQVANDLNSIETASLNAREIIKKLMAFARQLPPRKVPVNLNEVVNEGVSFFEARCAKSDIQLVCRLAADLPKITVDPGQINQVLVNLVVNAIHAMPEKGVLTVETKVTAEGISLSVEDTGVGIEEELKSRIFLPFFTTKDINEGTGLGLAVVHGIVTSHNGRIAVETKVGQGTRFVIDLPLTKPEKIHDEKG